MKRGNKKGVSAVVATVLIILITVAAVALVWLAVLPMLQTNLASGKVCLAASSSLAVDPASTCINSTTSMIKVRVSRSSDTLGGDFTLTGVKIIATDTAGSTNSTTVKTNLPQVNEDKVYQVYLGANLRAVTIAPIVKISNTDEECSKGTNPVELKACS